MSEILDVRLPERMFGCTEWAYAIPNKEAIAELVKLSPLVEFGAGTGYWASLIAAEGGQIVAFEPDPPEGGENTFGFTKSYAPLQIPGPCEASKHPGKTLFICWPSYGEHWAAHTVAKHISSGGTRFAYIGEDRDGCTGDFLLFNLLDTCRLIQEVEIPQWLGVHDLLGIYEYTPDCKKLIERHPKSYLGNPDMEGA